MQSLKQFFSISLGLALVLPLTACGGDDGGDGVAEACNPLGGPACLMPWPSATYLVEDSSTATGYRLNLPLEAMPTNADQRTINPEMFNDYDGFGIAAPILAAFEQGVSDQGLPTWQTPADSQAPDASVVVINMETNARVLIFAEPDMNAAVPEERALVIRPLERLQSGTRYAVAIRKSVKAADGSDLPMRPAMQALIDGTDFDHPRFDALVPRYTDIFATLEADGIDRDEILLAWDFVTASDEFLTSDLLAMRAQAMPAIGTDGANLSFDISEQSQDWVNVHKFLTGTFEVPTFLTLDELDPSIINRDANGAPELFGMGEATFAGIIPDCATTTQEAMPVIVFGHGLFGNVEDSVDMRFLHQVANDNCAIILGTDYIGLTNRQLTSVAFAMNDLNRGREITEKLAQAVINHIALVNIVRGPLRESDLFKYNDMELIDPTRIYYYGASLGGIMGGVFMAYDQTITRGVLGVAGGPWSLLYERSLAWPPLRVAMKGAYSLNPFDYQQNLSLMGMFFEKVDPMTTARRVIADPLPDTPAKQIFIYIGMGDTLVNNAASDALARSMNLPVTGPTLRMPFGMFEEQTTAPNGYTIYDENVEPWPPTTNVAPEEDNGTHGDVNERAAVQRQVTEFFFNGEVSAQCFLGDTPSPCDCSTGACD